METSTVVSLTAAHQKHGSYRKTAQALGVRHALVWNVLNGRAKDVSLATENALRLTLGLDAILPKIEIPPCPDCGSVHHGRCHGRQVALKPIRPRREPQYWRDYTPARLAAAIKQRQEYTAP